MVNAFEDNMVTALNALIRDTEVVGFAHRLPQIKYRKQIVDVLSDSPDPRFYLAVECKSMKEPGRLGFSDHFGIGKKSGRNQIELIDSFVANTGRLGFVAVEFRSVKEARLIPWLDVMTFYDAHAASIPFDFLKLHPAAKPRLIPLPDGKRKRVYDIRMILPTLKTP